MPAKEQIGHEHVTAAAYPARLGGVEYWFSPLTDQEWAEYIGWVRSEYVRFTRENVAALARDERLELIAASIERARVLKLSDPAAQEIALAPDGIGHLLWMHLRKRSPELTYESACSLFRDPADRGAALEAINLLNAPLPSTGDPKETARATG